MDKETHYFIAIVYYNRLNQIGFENSVWPIHKGMPSSQEIEAFFIDCVDEINVASVVQVIGCSRVTINEAIQLGFDKNKLIKEISNNG